MQHETTEGHRSTPGSILMSKTEIRTIKRVLKQRNTEFLDNKKLLESSNDLNVQTIEYVITGILKVKQSEDQGHILLT